MVHPPYLIPHLLGTLPSAEIKLVSALHVNLEKALQNPDPVVAAWFRHWITSQQHIRLPRYTTSFEQKRTCEKLGLPIDRVIHGGVDLNAFTPGRKPEKPGPLLISLPLHLYLHWKHNYTNIQCWQQVCTYP